MRILIVEDDADMLALLRLFLDRRRADVTCAADGVDAICEVARSIRTAPFDLMILDIAMRFVDGYSLAKAVRCFEHNGLYATKARIMFNTAHAEAFRNKALLKQTQVNLEDCFIKPADTSRLFDTLEELTK